MSEDLQEGSLVLSTKQNTMGTSQEELAHQPGPTDGEAGAGEDITRSGIDPPAVTGDECGLEDPLEGLI